jgi:glucan phosphorylase
VSSPFLMSDNPLKSTQLSSGHGVRTGLNVEDIKESFLDNLFYALNRAPALATKNDLYTALAMTVRDRVFHSSVRTIETYGEHKPRVVAYLSAEFLPGPHLSNNLLSLRFVAMTNAGLAHLVTERIGDRWLHDLYELRKLEPFADDAEFQRQWREVKLAAKRRLTAVIEERVGVRLNPGSLFDIQSKRIHEYKRQHLNVLHILTLYLRLKRDSEANIPARTFIFGGKAAPGYFMAKLIIKLVHAVAETVNNDPVVRRCAKFWITSPRERSLVAMPSFSNRWLKTCFEMIRFCCSRTTRPMSIARIR